LTLVVVASARPLQSASGVNVASAHGGTGVFFGATACSNSEPPQLVFLLSRSKNKFSIDLLKYKVRMYI